MDLTLTLILAVLLDHWLGEPEKHHPLAFWGQLATTIEATLNLSDKPFLIQRTFGLIAFIFMIFPFAMVIFLLSKVAIANTIINPVILYFCIASKSLKQHANNVFYALEQNNLSLARSKVAMIVSRQTEKMSSSEVRKASIESVLENGADAIFAPLFWFIIMGPTGAIIYRLSNTLDAMWGYKNSRYLHFGWAAARFDDVLNWVPARLTAISYALMGETRNALHCWKNQAPLLESPNAGPVMTAGAGALNIQLGGPAWYDGILKQKTFFGTTTATTNIDIIRSNALITSTLILWILMVFFVELVGVYFA